MSQVTDGKASSSIADKSARVSRRTRAGARSAKAHAKIERETPRRAIAMIAACPFPSHQGTQVFIRHLANALGSAGHAVHLVTYGESEGLRDVGLTPQVTWHRAPTPDVGLRSGPSAARVVADGVLLGTTLRLLKERYVEVLHVHNAESLAVGSVASRLTGVPLVYHAHTRLTAELPLYAGSALGRLVGRLGGAAFDQLLPRAADAVICFDPGEAVHLRRAGVAAERIKVVPLGLSMDELAVAASARPERATRPAKRSKRIIYAGNPDAYQNLALLRAAFARVRIAEPEAVLRLVSNHPAEAFGPLATDPGVEHCSFDGPAELAALLSGGVVGVVTRTLAAGAPVKALSYLSAGLPVVACETGAVGLLRGFPGACRLTASTPEAVADALIGMLGGNHRAGVEGARRAFDIHAQVPAYEAVYRYATGR